MANVIDTFLELVEDPAGTFVLEVGRPPRIVVGETQSDAQPMAMTRQDVLELLVPVIPAEARVRLRSDPIVTFGYTSGAGQAYDAEIHRDGPSMVVRFVRAAGTASTGGPAPGEDALADGAPPGDPGAQGVPLADRAVAERTSTPPPVAGAGHAIDALFRAMCERGHRICTSRSACRRWCVSTVGWHASTMPRRRWRAIRSNAWSARSCPR